MGFSPEEAAAHDRWKTTRPSGKPDCCDHQAMHQHLDYCPQEVAEWFQGLAQDREFEDHDVHQRVFDMMMDEGKFSGELAEAASDEGLYELFCPHCCWVGMALDAYKRHGNSEMCPECDKRPTIGIEEPGE